MKKWPMANSGRERPRTRTTTRRILISYEQDKAVTVAPREAGLTGFDDDFERGIVLDPIALGFVEKFVDLVTHCF